MTLLRKYTPTLRDLVKVDSLPENLGFLQDSLTNVLDKIYYKKSNNFKSSSGNSISYNLDLILYKKLVFFEIPGTGLAFIVNPPTVLGTQIGSEFNVSFGMQWEILKYVRNANLQSFGFDISSFVNLISDIFRITSKEMLDETIVVFVGDFHNSQPGEDPLQDFVTQYNSHYTPTLTYTPGTTTFDNLFTQIESSGQDVFQIIIDNYLANDFENFKLLIAKWIGPLDENRLKDLLIPKFNASINNISFGVEFPRNIFTPLDINDQPLPEPATSIIRVNAGSFSYDSVDGFLFEKDLSFDFQKSQILNSGFTLDLHTVKFDFSRTKNIAEADADGRPSDFVGVYIKDGTVGFPAFWNHNNAASTGELYVSNLLAGTGGLSGTIGLRGKLIMVEDPLHPGEFIPAPNTNNPGQFLREPIPGIAAKFGNFEVSIDTFSITFQQNSIIASDIAGTMKISGFKNASNNDAVVGIKIHIGNNGEFSVVAKESAGIVLRIPQVLDFRVTELSIGKKDGHYYIGVSGHLGFTATGVASALPKDVEIKKLIVWDNGKIELQGGTVTLSKPISLKIGPANLSITAIGFGSDERYIGGTLRKYSYFEFAAGLSIKPGGIDARGDGIKFYYSVDGLAFDSFIRIESIKIDLIIPGTATEKTANLIIKGYLSMKPATPPAVGEEYIGGVSFLMPKPGIGGSVGMRMNPKVPSFLIDVAADLSVPAVILPGVGIYGFRGLFGQKYKASRSAPALAATGFSPDGDWYQYYKTRVAPEYAEGVTVSKFVQKQGVSIGLGLAVATAGDGGKAFSSKVFFMVSSPGLFLFRGQAAMMRERVKITDPNDPPYGLLLVITDESLTTAFDINYKIPENSGLILKMNALVEMAFFFKNPNAWYINLGRDLPVEKRIIGRMFDLFDVYAYLMFSSTGIKAGAGASFVKSYNAGPLHADLQAYIDIAGRINYKPVQIGASLSLGGSVKVSIWRFSVYATANLTLAGEIPHPFYMTGTLEASITVSLFHRKKKRNAKKFHITLEFTWIFDRIPNTSEISLHAGAKAIKARNVLTQETYPLYTIVGGLSNVLPSVFPIDDPNSDGHFDTYTIPLDSYIDIEFLKPIMGNASGEGIAFIGGAVAVNNYDQVPQVPGKLPPVNHTFILNRLVIKHWDPSSNTWKPFDIYNALSPLSIPGVNALKPTSPKYGYWQYDTATHKINKLSLLAMSPLEYYRNAVKFIPSEYLGISSQNMFCPPPKRSKVCVAFNSVLGTTFIDSEVSAQGSLMFRVVDADGKIKPISNPFGFTNGLLLEAGSSMEIYFPEPTSLVELTMLMSTQGLSVSYYMQQFGPETDVNNIALTQYVLVKKTNPTISTLMKPLVYDDLNNPVKKVVIETGTCNSGVVSCTLNSAATALQSLFNVLIENQALGTDDSTALDLKQLPYSTIYNQNLAAYLPTNTKHFYYTDNLETGSDTIHMWIGSPDQNTVTITLHAPILISLWDVASFANIRPDPDFYVTGTNYHFLVDVTIPGGTFTLQGTSSAYPIASCKGGILDYNTRVCTNVNQQITTLQNQIIQLTREKNIATEICRAHTDGECASVGGNYCERALELETEIYDITQQIATLTTYSTTQCGTVNSSGSASTNTCGAYIFKVCSMSKTDYGYNTTIPSFTEVGSNMTAMDAINNSLQPVWRPNTIYGIEMETLDSISGGPQYISRNSYLFRTAGPVGHFHEKRPEYTALSEDKKDLFRLKSIKDYIDYERSYPNPNGNIINAKPLFYGCPKLLLFFVTPQVYSMYNNFDAYDGLAPVTSALQAVIKDPTEPNDLGTPLTGPVKWEIYDDGMKTKDVQTLTNLMNGPMCVSVQQITKAKGSKIEIDLCGLIKPLKLYNAVYNAIYNGVSRDVHTYSFQTSQYANFKQQIESYQIKDENGAIKKYAFFDIDKAFDAGTSGASPTGIELAKSIVNGNEPQTTANGSLRDFAQPYDRLVTKAFELPTVNPAITTEFNMLVDTSTGNPTSGNVLGILISNPEPFNDPKLKGADLQQTIAVVTDSSGNTIDNNYKVIISKDGSKAFVTHKSGATDLNITASLLYLRFQYLEYNGTAYVLNNPALNQVVVPVDVKAPLTTLIAADSGRTNVPLDDTLQATLVTGAVGYEFKIEHAASSFSASYIRNSADGQLPLVEITGLMYNKTYNISVRPILSGRITRFGAASQVSTKVLSYVVVQPANILQGQSQLIQIEVQDISGNISHESQNGVTLVANSSDAIFTNSGLVNIVNGVGSISITDIRAETVVLSFVDSQNTGLNVSNTGSMTFTPSPATKLVIENPVDTVDGMQATITVHARNSFLYNDIDTNFNGTVKVTVSDNATIANSGIVTIVNGTGTIQVTDTVPETITLALQDVAATGLDVMSTQDIIFANAPATLFVIADPTDSIQGIAVTVTITARNQFGYIDTNYNGTVQLHFNGSATAPAPGDGIVTITNGTGTIDINDTVAETVHLTLTNTGTNTLNVSSNKNVVFGIATATKLVILDPTDAAVNSTITVTVQAQNNFGTVDTAYQHDVTLNTSGTNATGAGLVNIVNGVGTIDITNTVAETVTLTLSDTESTGLDVTTSTQDVTWS